MFLNKFYMLINHLFDSIKEKYPHTLSSENRIFWLDGPGLNSDLIVFSTELVFMCQRLSLNEFWNYEKIVWWKYFLSPREPVGRVS